MKSMQPFYLLTEETFEYVSDRLGDCSEKLPDNIEGWYDDITRKTEGYLVKKRNEETDSFVYGFLYTCEFSHMGQREDTDGFEWAHGHGLREENDVYGFMEEMANEIKGLNKNLEVYLGKKSGFDECHEFCIFFVSGTENNYISNTIKNFEELFIPKAQEKWLSFLDLLE